MSRVDAVIPWGAPDLGDDEVRAVVETLRSGWITMGPRTRAFEDAVAHLLGVRFAVATTSGTTALEIALGAIGVGRGNEVIVPALTHVSTVHAIVRLGATPVMVDVEPVGLNLDPVAVQAAITPRTRVVMTIDYGGCAADYDAFEPLARSRGLVLLQDAAHSFGGDHRGRAPGTFGVGATLSFHAAKLITTGEGGMVVTDDGALAARARALRNQGEVLDAGRTVAVVGQNARLTDLQAALGLAQLPKLAGQLARRHAVAAWYREALADVPGIVLPAAPAHVRHAYFLFAIRCPDLHTRDRAESALAAAGVETRVCWRRPVYREPAYAAEPPRRPCPVAEAAADRLLSLPVHPFVTPDGVARVCAVLRATVS